MLSRRHLIGAAALVLAASQAAFAADKPYRLGYMIWSSGTPYSSALISSSKKQAEIEGVQLDVQSGNGDLATQISIVQQFIAQKVDAILLDASDPKGVIPAVRQANAAGIPILTFSQDIDKSTGVDVVTFVGVDDFAFGQLQGKLLVDSIGEKGRVAYIMGVLGSNPQIQRKAGLEDALKQYPGIEFVDSQAADWDNAKALAVTQDFLSRYPEGSLAAILGQGPEGATGAAFAAQQGRKDVKFLLGDYPASVEAAIRNGTVHGTTSQDPTQQGAAVVKDAVLYLDGKKDQVPAPTHYLEVVNVTKENVDQHKAAW